MDIRLLVLALGTFSIGTDSFVVAGILPDVARSFDIEVAAAGQLITVYALAYALMTPVMATVTAHWQRRTVLVAGLAVFIVGNVLTALLPTYDLILASRALAGLGGAIFTPAASATAAALVSPERRGRALAIVMAGLSGATALGAPIGTLVGSLGDWRLTMWFVALLGLLAMIGVRTLLPQMTPPPALRLRERLAPVADPRVAMTLLTTLFVLSGLYTVYTYISIAFERATDGDGSRLAALISIWGVAAIVGNLAAGSLTDRFGSRRIINISLVVAVLDFAFMPMVNGTFAGASVVLVIWGLAGWGILVPQQHRLIGIAPAKGPLVIALNAAAIYIGVSLSGALGAVVLHMLAPGFLGPVGAVLILAGLVTAELANRLIAGRTPTPVASGAAPESSWRT
ncbi:MFS transporter [Mesorhizobium sp. 8]|uniref:MFS transporter n=1 Tax=Mesorhizobium sp. 8 TaxID=2584466 RepID=UPI0011224485|nr:MFS transporter [Mesorhizobium sp. 8]QDC02178.1 MFS transporter [Mesorhizobium sp. 8]